MEPAPHKRQQFQAFTVLVEHVVLRLRRDVVHHHQPTTTLLRWTLSNPFNEQRQSPQHDIDSNQVAKEKPITSVERLRRTPSTRRKSLKKTPKLSREVMANNLHQVEDYVRQTNVRVQDLEALMLQEHSTIGQVTELKRQLKTAHRTLEKLHFEKCPSLGVEVNNWVAGAMRLAWQAYRRMVKLEDKLRGLPVSLSDGEEYSNDYEKTSPVTIGIGMEPRMSSDFDTMAGAAKEPEARRVQPVTYVPTGARGPKLSGQTPDTIAMSANGKQKHHRDTYRMSGALPFVENLAADLHPKRPSSEIHRAAKFKALPRLITSNQGFSHDGYCDDDYDSDDSLYETRQQRCKREFLAIQETNPGHIPHSREEVEDRIQREESELAPILIEPDRQRQGSCNGSLVTVMVMSNARNEELVLPCLHFIKHHELRALKDWLVDNHYVKKSGTISRTEKVLHCLELLQTGLRYETIAVIFSRTPRQVESSCHEVMEGLLELHGFTMIKARDQEMYTTLWGIWNRKFGNPQNQTPAACYYGFNWLDVGKVMVTLNLYIGRWREQGKFALEGPSLNWGKFFNAEGTGKFPRMDQALHLQYSTVGSSDSAVSTHKDEEDDNGSLYEGCAVQTA